ncbi:calcium-binding protein [Novosphingobium cyanobacteriorum]|uniref:Calcium-binding protein n=1 Tax=Novosphingobium cyanobacteriorum TaxID=3024215 RepID=A0ABT6CME8_9SPHN|nr:calcium-binding protein [Novosphingobium cyanobacteriorum]MDF8334981.1 calcium-binding protein [Novosphingobium cyanobacteriorum]
MAGTTITLPAGATESTIQAAFDKARDGDTIILPKDAVIQVREGLSLDVSNRSVTVDLNGATLQQAGDATVLSVQGGHVDGVSAKIGSLSGGQVTVAYSGASNVKVGDFVKIYSDDEIPDDQGAATRLGQAMKVVAVNGNTLTLEGDLHYAALYKTNVRASAYESGKAVVTNGTVRGDQSHPTWTNNLIDLRSTVDATIDKVVVRDGNSMGINFVDCVNGKVTQSAAINLTDDPANGHFGYGVHSASSTGTTVDGFYAEKVRHATDDNAVGLWATHVNPSKYGADFGMTVSNVVAVETTSFAFSWHSEGRYNVTTDSLVFDSYGVMGGRGVDNTFANVSGSGNERGILFFEYGEGDGKRISVSDVYLKEHYGFAYFKQNNATDNSIDNSYFEVLSNKITISPTDPSTSITDTTVKVGAFATDEKIVGSSIGDRLLGALGDDVIYGNGGKDLIWGGQGGDTLYGGSSSDRFAYRNVNEAGDVIKDFQAGAGGDVIDVSQMFFHYGWKSTLGHVRFVQSGADTLFQVDLDGGVDNYVTMARLEGVTASTMTSANLSTSLFVSSTGLDKAGTITSTDIGTKELPAAFSDLIGYALQIGTTTSAMLLGTDSSDLLIGSTVADTLTGNDGNDVLAGGAGADILMGGAGNDTASYANASGGLTASLINPSANTGDAKGDVYKQIENLTGSAFADKITGSDSVNTLSGGSGNDLLYGLGGTDTLYGGTGWDQLFGGNNNDRLFGGWGNDVLTGGAGYDKLTGGSGADKFVFDAPSAASDTIMDFEHGIDKVVLSGSDYGVASLSSFSFVSGTRPTPTSNAPTLMYNTSSGALWFDPDGVGWRGASHVGDFANLPALSLSDFIVI